MSRSLASSTAERARLDYSNVTRYACEEFESSTRRQIVASSLRRRGLFGGEGTFLREMERMDCSQRTPTSVARAATV